MNIFRRDYMCPQCGSKRVSLKGENLPPLGEVDYWAPVREEGFWCMDCDLHEYSQSDAGAAFKAFHKRWNDDLDRAETPEEIAEYEQWSKEVDARREAYDREWTWPVERDELEGPAWRAARLAEERAEARFWDRGGGRTYGIAFDPELESRILAQPNDSSARWALVRWLREQSHPLAADAAAFIEGQLKLAEGFAADPRSDLRAQLSSEVFHKDQAYDWWRYPSPRFQVESLYAFDKTTGDGLVAEQRYFRGFIEHVAIKASRFLEIADELYSLAPIRQLTITYCKGPQHDDLGLFKALLESPHLDRIRALKFPVRVLGVDNQYTELNRLTDDDIAMLAASEHLRGLRVLDLEDQRKLSIAAFDALAASKKLPELSAVYSDIYHYYHPGTFTFGTVGGQQRQRFARPLVGYAPKLEARHGWIPWLHVAEYYGSELPDIEAVIENPIALAKRT